MSVRMIVKRATLGVALVFGLSSVGLSSATAAPINDALTATTFDAAAGRERSWDGTNIEFHPLTAFIQSGAISAAGVNRLGEFSSGALGSILEVVFGSMETALYNRNGNPDFNRFGFVADGGAFTPIGNTLEGEEVTIALAPNQSIGLALSNRGGQFNTIDISPDFNQPVFLFYDVLQDVTLNLGGTDRLILAGSLLFFAEDLFVESDFDYNDVTGVIRQTEVPEPSSLILLGVGGVAAFSRRRRQAA